MRSLAEAEAKAKARNAGPSKRRWEVRLRPYEVLARAHTKRRGQAAKAAEKKGSYGPYRMSPDLFACTLHIVATKIVEDTEITEDSCERFFELFSAAPGAVAMADERGAGEGGSARVAGATLRGRAEAPLPSAGKPGPLRKPRHRTVRAARRRTRISRIQARDRSGAVARRPRSAARAPAEAASCPRPNLER